MAQSQVRFNRILKKVPEKVPGGFGAKPGQVQQGTEEFWRRFQKVLEKVPEKVGKALVQSQVRFNRILKKVPEKVPGGFGAEPGQVQQDSEEGSGEGSWRLWCRARAGSTGFRRRFRRSGRVWCRARLGLKRVPGEGCREGVGKGFGNLWWRARSGATDSRGFPALGFAARFRKMLRLFGIPPKLIFGFCSEKVPGSLGAKQGQIQHASGEGFGDFGAEPDQVQQGPGEGSGAGGCGAKSDLTGKVVPEKVPGGLGAEPGQLQQGSEEVSGEGLR